MKKTKAAAGEAAGQASLSREEDPMPADERAPNRVDSKFRFVLVSAQRAEQLMRGARPKVEVAGRQKPTKVAMQEVSSDLVDWDYGPAPAPAPSESTEPGAEEQPVPAEEVH
jgi:DNA-directed RNA polymerase omega subunit